MARLPEEIAKIIPGLISVCSALQRIPVVLIS
jgi:hypothetical protein